MYKYACLNAISQKGLSCFNADYGKTDDIQGADAILVRSANMHEMHLDDSVLAIARAGAGVNNIPLDKYAERGVVVFNTPGANANGVKEMVFAGMLLAARDIVGGVNWINENVSDLNIAKDVEKQKSSMPEPSFPGRNWASSVSAQSDAWSRTPQSISGWMCMAMIPTFPSTPHGT